MGTPMHDASYASGGTIRGMLNQYIIKVGVAHLFKFVEKTFMDVSHANSKICVNVFSLS